MDFLREWEGEEGVGGGGPGVSVGLVRGVEGREGVLDGVEEVDEGWSSQESAMGVLLVVGLVEGEMERFFRERSRPRSLLGDISD